MKKVVFFLMIVTFAIIAKAQNTEEISNKIYFGDFYYKLGDFEQAEKNYLEAKNMIEKEFGKEHPDYAQSLNNLGLLYKNMGNYA